MCVCVFVMESFDFYGVLKCGCAFVCVGLYVMMEKFDFYGVLKCGCGFVC